MIDSRELESLERGAYRQSYSDGIIDTFVGVSLLWIGAVWVWLPDFGGLAGVLPAVFITAVLQARKRIIEARGGYVKWREPRRRWERRNLVAIFAAGVLLFAAGVGTFVAFGESSSGRDTLSVLAPGLLAWLLALLAMGLAFMMTVWRMIAYAGVLAVAGALTMWAQASPGWPLLAAGIVVTTGGVSMLVRFVRRNPAIPAA